jgi:hypothetical protein
MFARNKQSNLFPLSLNDCEKVFKIFSVELLTSVRAYMNILQSVENHIHIDMTR